MVNGKHRDPTTNRVVTENMKMFSGWTLHTLFLRKNCSVVSRPFIPSALAQSGKSSPMSQFSPKVSLPVTALADLQDSLLVVMNDLQRLGGLLDHATENLMDRFSAANEALAHMGSEGSPGLPTVRKELQLAVTELQFHDMASQLLVHTDKILKACAYKLAEEAMGMDESEESSQGVQLKPPRPNPVTQSEMDAGSIELF
jgi:hypothetical protein